MLNQVSIVGYLATEPRIIYTNLGTKVYTFIIGCDRDYLSDDGKTITEYYNCVAYHYTGEFISKYLSKGEAALISGSLRMRKWVDNDGMRRKKAEILVDNAYLVGWKKEQTIVNQERHVEEAPDDAFFEIWDAEAEYLSP